MKVKIEIECDNAAFIENDNQTSENDNQTREVARILRSLAGSIEEHPHFLAGHEFPLYDFNGNKVGFMDVLA